MKRIIVSMLIWGGLAMAQDGAKCGPCTPLPQIEDFDGTCRIMAEVLPLQQRDKRVSDRKLMTIRLLVVTPTCGREISDYNILTVETRKSHTLKPGDRVTLRSLDRTPRGKLLVEVNK